MMGDADFRPGLVVGVLATWRLTHLLAHEDGPGDILARARRLIGNGWAGRLFDCFNCLSLFVAVPATLWLATDPVSGWWIWLALSGAACLLERLGGHPIDFAHLPETQEDQTHVMLRT